MNTGALAVLLLAACSTREVPRGDVRLGAHLETKLCAAANVTVGTIGRVETFDADGVAMSHAWLDVDASLAGTTERRLHLVLAGAEVALSYFGPRPGPGEPIRPAVGLRYLLVHGTFVEPGLYVDAGDPAISASILLDAATGDRKLQAVREHLKACRNPDAL